MLARSRGLIFGVIAVALVTFALVTLLTGDPDSPTVAAAPAPTRSSAGDLTVQSLGENPKKTETRASGPSKYSDAKALAYFQAHWDDAATRRITDIRTTGRYLRIYTNLPESAHNAKHALTLCRRGLEYLAEIGETYPIVFVQAEFGQNGNPVLANILGPDDTNCRVTHPAPET